MTMDWDESARRLFLIMLRCGNEPLVVEGGDYHGVRYFDIEFGVPGQVVGETGLLDRGVITPGD